MPRPRAGSHDRPTTGLTVATGATCTLCSTIAERATTTDSQTSNAQQNRIWKLCIRAYRGITNPNRPGLGTCKDHVYRAGLKKIRNIDIENTDIQKILFAGNVGLHHLNIVKHLDLSYVKIPELISK